MCYERIEESPRELLIDCKNGVAYGSAEAER